MEAQIMRRTRRPQIYR